MLLFATSRYNLAFTFLDKNIYILEPYLLMLTSLNELFVHNLLSILIK